MSKVRKSSGALFEKTFTQLVSEHLSQFPPKEQDRLIAKANAVVSKVGRDDSSMPREADGKAAKSLVFSKR